MSFHWTDLEVRRALGLNPGRARADLAFGRVCSDSRNLEEGDLFVALVGERFDGHDFVPEALARGAGGAVVSRDVAVEEAARLYPVPDTLEALGRLARHRRHALKAKVVAITGSSGKTTTKDFMREALSGSFRVHATPGNLNNRVGLPQTLLAAPADTQLLVLEMGTNEPGEIGALTRVAEPDVAVITTVSETHLEKLGSLEGVLEEKLELVRGLGESGTAVVGDEPPVLARGARELAATVRVVGWSDGADADARPQEAEITERGCYRFRWRGESVTLRIPGRHSVQNALLALEVAHLLGVSPRDAARRIGKVQPGSMRSEIRILGSLTLLLDCYNANPQSVRAALDLLQSMQQLGSRVAVLGSMLELGEGSRLLHRGTLEDALDRPLDLVVATGLFAEAAQWVSLPAGGPELVVAPELAQAETFLMERLGGSEVVLLKASRGVAMETLLPALESRFGPSMKNPGPPGAGGSGGGNEKAVMLPAGKEA